MNHKSFLILIATLFLAVGALSAQDVKTKKADRYYDLFQFDKAIKQYQRVIKKEPDNYHALVRLGDSYRLLGNPADAEFWYGSASKHISADSTVVFNYAQALRSNGKYTDAKEQYKRYSTMAPNDPRGASLAKSMDEINKLKADSLRYNVINIGVANTVGSEFSPSYYQDTMLVFPSNRGAKGKDVWQGGAFLDLYTGAISNDTAVGDVQALGGKVNSKFHEGPVTFNKDYTVMYFTRNSFVKSKKKGEKDIMRLSVFKSKLENGNWGSVERLPFNNDDFTCGHPTLSADGKYLYFSSDMPGGFGGLDLWRVSVAGDTYGTPENLGEGVNGAGNEQFAFLHEDGTLFFASDGLVGLGGLDVYYAAPVNGKYGSPTNMGYPINTHFDDLGLIFNKKKKKGYFASNRGGGVGDDDIYYFDTYGLRLKVIVYDRLTGDPIDSAYASLLSGTDTLGKVLTENGGAATFKVETDKSYGIYAAKDGYLPNKVNVSTIGLDNSSPAIRVPLDRGDLMLVGTTFEVKVDDNTKEEVRVGPLPGTIVKLHNLTDKTIDSTTTGQDGKFAFQLKSEKEYKLDGDKELYFLKSEKNFDTKGKISGIVEADLELYKLAGVIRLVNIYYDFDKYNIRPDAAKELDRLYGYLVKYPDMVIQMRSHTDCRGSKVYNMRLSANRAQSAANYLIGKGMTNGILNMMKTITAAGFGETLPIYGGLCADDQGIRDGLLSQDLIDKHQFNRRTEFLVLVQPKAIYVESSVKK
jgi:outer membrane protein OmpA-like peptidoglycan-associated protein